ncbi:hypothetical protein AGMMS50229_10540 [Campylobacterota bacterium]|nr:hypothetical protein AGMMS50229_10540 [Campylobacterota bacterium]
MSEELLKQRITALEKMCNALMDRVEHSTDSIGNDYALFEHSIVLQNSVNEKTKELEARNIELHKALDNLQDATDQMIQSEKLAALGSLVAGIAHEVNTPLGISVTAASHLEDTCHNITNLFETGAMKKSDLQGFIADCNETTRIVTSNLSRAADLIQSFKKIAVDQSSEVRQTIALAAYLRDIIVSLTPKLKKTQIKVTIDCPEEFKLSTLPGSITQVLTNLVSNSLLHGYQLGSAGEIEIKVKTRGTSAIIVYSDDGRGIAPEHLSKIYEPFFTTKRGQGGSGLGLHLIFNIVTHSLGGTIDCKSTVGHGATFTITLPESIVLEQDAKYTNNSCGRYYMFFIASLFRMTGIALSF